MAVSADKLLAGLATGPPRPVFLIQGDLVLAVPAAERVAAALAAAAGCAVETHRRPPSLGLLLEDLRTFSLFTPGKVLLAVDTAALADRGAAAELIDDAREALPLGTGGGGSGINREGASRLLQALRLFDLDPYTGTPEELVGQLPAWALEGAGGRRKGKRQVEELRAGLAALLEAARREEVQGTGTGGLSDLADAIRSGLPPGHALVLAERAVAADHPIVALLEERAAVARVGEVEAERGGGWQGLDLLAGELARQTGSMIAPDALAELARRTLRQGSEWKKADKGAEADSTARFAGEYRKLANLAGSGGRIERRLVAESVEDRGEEDVWQLLDAVGAGRGAEALDRLRRMISGAEDPGAARLGFFTLLAGFCRQLTAVRGLMDLARVPPGEASYPRFRDRHAPALQAELPGGGKNPVAGLHPFRLHRAYLAVSRMPAAFLAKLPSDVLEAELQLKGESGNPDAALAHLVTRLAGAGRR